jgi:hypothetical protein
MNICFIGRPDDAVFAKAECYPAGVTEGTLRRSVTIPHDCLTFEDAGLHSRLVRYFAAAGARILGDSALVAARNLYMDARSSPLLTCGSKEVLAAVKY